MIQARSLKAALQRCRSLLWVSFYHQSMLCLFNCVLYLEHSITVVCFQFFLVQSNCSIYNSVNNDVLLHKPTRLLNLLWIIHCCLWFVFNQKKAFKNSNKYFFLPPSKSRTFTAALLNVERPPWGRFTNHRCCCTETPACLDLSAQRQMCNSVHYTSTRWVTSLQQ